VRRWRPGEVTRTNSNGEFRFAELLPGEYKVMTQELLDTDPETLAPGSQVYGFPPACFPGVPDFASGTTLTVGAGQHFQADIPLSRQPYYRVKLPVLNSDSSMAISITVLAQSHPGPGYSLGYNPGTRSVEGLLPNGTFLVEATSFGPTIASGEVNITIAGRPVQAPTLVLSMSGVIPVNVQEDFTSEWPTHAVWSDGKRTFELHGPRSYLSMSLEPVDDFAQVGRPSLRPPRLQPNEPLVIENATPGAYWVRFSTQRGYVQSMTSNGTDLLRQPLTVTSGSPAPIEVTMRDDTAAVAGTVAGVRSAGNENSTTPVRGSPAQAYVYCVPLPDSPGTLQMSVVMSDGTFALASVAPGAYRVLAFAHPEPNLAYRDVAAMRAYDGLGPVVNLVAGQTEHLQLQVIRGNEHAAN
jgi:hypothetical protein